jgi:hypothetical protein
MATIEIFIGKHGTFLIQSTSEDSDFMSVVEQYKSITGEAAKWREVCETQKRAKALCDSHYSAEDELKFYEKQLVDAAKCRRALINQITKISNYLASPASSENSKIDKEIKNIEIIQKMLNFIDREVIQKLLTVVRGLEKEEKKRVSQTRRIRSSNYKDKRYIRRVKETPRPTS